jgi:hypothetical protein
VKFPTAAQNQLELPRSFRGRTILIINLWSKSGVKFFNERKSKIFYLALIKKLRGAFAEKFLWQIKIWEPSGTKQNFYRPEFLKAFKNFVSCSEATSSFY